MDSERVCADESQLTVPLRVLIVEDSQDDTALLVRELRRGGYEPTFERVDTPTAMSAAVDSRQWDLVICDYSIPHFSGTAALRLLRDKGSEVPFIFLSGTIGEETAIAALKQGAGLCYEGQSEALASGDSEGAA